VAAADLLASLACLGVSIPLLAAAVGIGPRDYWRSLWRPLLAAAVMGWAAWVVVVRMPHSNDVFDALSKIVAGSAVGITVYLATYFLLWRAAGRPQTIEPEAVRRAGEWLRARLLRK
jgi:peptidoglycan biosynthesis protein MviN/MurJ (putative lipid II flippase)